MIKTAYLFVFLFLIAPLFVSAGEVASVTDERTGIEIIFIPESRNIFPENWMRAPINGNWKKVRQSEVERTARIFKKALDKYPAGMPGSYITKIYVFDYLSFYGVSYGGTYHKDALYITNGGENDGYTDEFLEGSFHHEFSSVVLNENYSLFDERGWKKINPRGFYYSDEDYGGAGAIMEGRSSLELSDSLNTIGFLNEYSQSTIENDFNEFARNMFLGNKDFHARLSRNTKLQKKFEIITAVYGMVDFTFTKEYFYNISNN